jgi:hypothetical protein
MQSISPKMDICCELEKLPAIIHHFQHHQEEDGDSFVQFVYEDLLSTTGSKEGHHNDSNREDSPFQGNHNCSHAPLAFLSYQFDDVSIVEYYKSAKFGTYLSKAPQGFSESPFQPPKG